MDDMQVYQHIRNKYCRPSADICNIEIVSRTETKIEVRFKVVDAHVPCAADVAYSYVTVEPYALQA